MAQRLATEYVKTCLVLDEAQLSQMFQMFQSHNLLFKVKVLDHGDQEVVIENASGPDALTLTFERRLGKYVLEGSCRFTDLRIANAMRKAVAQFKGDAVVNRIYEYHTVQYHYLAGAVVRITELTQRGERLVYEYKDTAGELLKQFQSVNVEAEIQVVKLEINELLDRRNASGVRSETDFIDAELRRLSNRLFALEA
ncbi:non-ribosomal peptide synthetase module [Paenibacillus sp.]|uniref:non-ribosomal peptide synthetase module n=1 Tax=Paenibacillus sp. TaxID=58172 RepID=UPI002D43D549|nr:non-ribosomal peptide synthetase module [Paenibacillus sp.]HZG56385.1 non-ribosomal peptide synthetase module [Paenibacillus sp.]